MSGLGTSFMKIWTCGSSPRSGSRNAWTRIKNVNGDSRLSKFVIFSSQFKWSLSRLVTMDETWLYHYDPETKQQSREWRHNGSPHPQKFRAQKSAGKFLYSIFSDQNGILLIDCLPKGQTVNTEYYLSLLVQLKDTLKEKRRPREGHQGGLVLVRQCPGSPGTCNPEETGLPGLPMSWSPTLFSGSGPVGLPPVPWTEKNKWKFAIFHPTGRSLLPWGPGWTDNHLNFFFLSGLQKLEQRAKKCIELRGEYVEYIPSLVAIACFLPSRAKDLSAPPRISYNN